VVNIANPQAKGNIPLDGEDGIIGHLRKGLVHQFQHQPGAKKEQNQNQSNAAQAPGMGKSGGLPWDPAGTKMENKGSWKKFALFPHTACPFRSSCNRMADAGYQREGGRWVIFYFHTR